MSEIFEPSVTSAKGVYSPSTSITLVPVRVDTVSTYTNSLREL